MEVSVHQDVQKLRSEHPMLAAANPETRSIVEMEQAGSTIRFQKRLANAFGSHEFLS
jgi:hypothetical protein